MEICGNVWEIFRNIIICLIEKLDWESIRSSPRDGSSMSYRLTKGWLGFSGWVVVVGWVVGPQDFWVIPWHFENGPSSKIDDVLGHVGLTCVLPVIVHLEFFMLDGLRESF